VSRSDGEVPGALDEFPEAMIIMLLRTGRRHADDHQRFAHAAQCQLSRTLTLGELARSDGLPPRRQLVSKGAECPCRQLGGMAEYMLVPSMRLLVALGNLSPAKAAPLSDAALTPYHAIKRALPLLNPDSTVVLGVGGLGHMATQLLRVLAPVRIAAADVDDKKLQQGKRLGARRHRQQPQRR
jgi:D-arabinose 1-dehydrogenase-like Zn-dependent alcohol dehydrogenase